MELSHKLQDILLKLERIQAKMAELEADNAALREERTVLSEKLRQAKAVVAENRMEVAGAGQTKEDVSGRALSEQDIRQQIDRYISEIDKCIEWLSAQ
jgi:regulator of replication initiation timing